MFIILHRKYSFVRNERTQSSNECSLPFFKITDLLTCARRNTNRIFRFYRYVFNTLTDYFCVNDTEVCWGLPVWAEPGRCRCRWHGKWTAGLRRWMTSSTMILFSSWWWSRAPVPSGSTRNYYYYNHYYYCYCYHYYYYRRPNRRRTCFSTGCDAAAHTQDSCNSC